MMDFEGCFERISRLLRSFEAVVRPRSSAHVSEVHSASDSLFINLCQSEMPCL
jgi:hypothetical protein